MKKLNSFLNVFISWAYIIITIILGVIFTMAALGQYGMKENIELVLYDQLNGPNGIWTGIVLLLLGILFLNMRLKESMSEKSITFANPEGKITITVKAIEDFVEKVGQEFSQVIDLKPSIISSKEGISISAKAVLVAGTHVPRLAEGIQHTIKNRIQTILGIENITTVEVHISKLVAKKGNGDESSQHSMAAL